MTGAKHHIPMRVGSEKYPGMRRPYRIQPLTPMRYLENFNLLFKLKLTHDDLTTMVHWCSGAALGEQEDEHIMRNIKGFK